MQRYGRGRFDDVKGLLLKTLNNKQKLELEEKYHPQTFDGLNSVENIYPLHAIRSIELTSWCPTDFIILEDLVHSAHQISKSARNKYIIAKRGKFQKYAKYDN